MDETPGMDETPAMDETPGMDETPAVDETPADGGEEVDEAALIQTGGSVYAAQCAGCHQPDGEGIPDTYPALNQESDVIDEDPTEIIQIVLQGRDNMPSFAQLSDEEIAGVLSYIRSEWDNDAAPVMPAQVAEQR